MKRYGIIQGFDDDGGWLLVKGKRKKVHRKRCSCCPAKYWKDDLTPKRKERRKARKDINEQMDS